MKQFVVGLFPGTSIGRSAKIFHKILIVKMFTINRWPVDDSENPSPIIPLFVPKSLNFSTSAIPMPRAQTVPIQTSSVNLVPGITTA